MKRLILFFLTLSTAVGFSQNFRFVAGDTLTKVFEINDYSWANTKIENFLEEPAIYQWHLSTFDHPEGWEFTLCDLPQCYTSGETTGTMSIAGPLSEDAFLTVNIEATYPDTGFYQIEVWNQAIPGEIDTLSVTMIATPAFSSLLDELSESAPFYHFQKGAQVLRITNPSENPIAFHLYNSLGQLIIQTNLIPNSEKSIQLSTIKSGTYITYMENLNGEISTDRILIP